MDKFLKKLGIKDQNDLLLYTGIAAVSWILATNYFKKGNALSFYSSYDTTTTTTAGPTVQELKDKILQNIIQRAQDVNVVITNLESIKTKIETYNAKLELLAGEIAGSRLPTYVIQQYLQSIIKEIAEALEIKLNLPMAGGWSGSYAPWYNGDPLGGWADQNPYSDYYQQYINNLKQYYDQYYGSYSFYDPQSMYYQPNYYYPQTNPYYSYQQTYNPGYQGYSSQQYGYGYPNYGYSQGGSPGYGGYTGQGGYGGQGYGQYPYY
jgi:hypothetical protein